MSLPATVAQKLETPKDGPTVTAILTTVIISPYAELGRPRRKEPLKELYISAPYNLCVNTHGGSLYVFESSKCRGAKSRSTPIQISKSFADQCLHNFQTRKQILHDLYLIFGKQPPRSSNPDPDSDEKDGPESPCTAHGKSRIAIYLKANKAQIREGQYLAVTLGNDTVHVYNDYAPMYYKLKQLCDDDDSKSYYTRYTVDPNVDSDEEELIDEKALGWVGYNMIDVMILEAHISGYRDVVGASVASNSQLNFIKKYGFDIAETGEFN